MDELKIRHAQPDDLPALVRLLADDQLGAQRESPHSSLDGYLTALDAIDADPNNELLVACLRDEVVGTLQLTFIPGLSHQGAWRAQVEAVRVDARLRSQGLGRALMTHAIGRARERGCRLLQLTTNKVRTRAHRFYERLGFIASHEGMKLSL